jgi:hypothetical protein
MKALKHIQLSPFLVVGMMLAGTCLAPCGEKVMGSDEDRAEKIEARIKEALEDWSSEAESTRPAYDAMVREIFDALSDNEISLVAQHVHGIDVEEEAFRRWSRFDPAGALKAVRAIEDKNAAEIRLAGTGLEGGPGEAMSAWVFGMYLAALDGWSDVAPKAAWESFKQREGPLAKSLVVEDYTSYFYEVLFEHLARTEPDFAFNEFMVADLGEYEELNGVGILQGYLRSAPQGRDWMKVLEQSLSRGLPRGWRFYSVLRTDLMGRWLEDDPDAAKKWFSGGDIEGLNWTFVEPPSGDLDRFESDSDSPKQQQAAKEKRRNDLGSAAGYWAARDFPAAWRWMKAYRAYSREGFEAEVLDGMSAFFNEERWGSQTDAREHCLKAVATLPDQLDRDQFALRFATVLWVFDDTEFLGQPPPDKAKWLEKVRGSITTLRLSPEAASAVMDALQGEPKSEQDGAGQPATRPESKSEGGENTKPESGPATR